MPFDIIRTMEFLQDQVARGNARALRVQALLLQRFSPVLLAAPAGVWDDARNRRAAVLFALSGGPPAVLRQLLKAGMVPEGEKPLFEGAIAYLGNDLRAADRALSTLDLDALEPGLAAHVSLVLGQIEQIDHPEAAVRHLDRARLLAPGGLIEESALRLEMLIADGLGRHALADSLSRRYFDRYPASAYAANFEARFALVYATRRDADAPTIMARMLDATASLAPGNRRAVLLAVGRRALVDGRLELADLASGEALKSAGITDADRQRASLYLAAATLARAGPEAGAGLSGIARDRLHPDDAKLLDAASSVLGDIDRSLAEPAAGLPPVPDPAEADSPIFARARALLDDAPPQNTPAKP